MSAPAAWLLALAAVAGDPPPLGSPAAVAAGEEARGGAADSPAAGEGVFEPAPVLDLRIEISPAGAEALRKDPRTFVAAVLWEGNRAHPGIGIRLKGSLGSFRPIDSDRPGLTARFDFQDKRGRFHGLRRIHLDNSVQDPTYLAEWIGNELFRAAGVPAARVGWATLILNGRRRGVYVLRESFDPAFLDRSFGDSSGNHYEGPPDIGSLRLDVDSRGGTSDRVDLAALVEACGIRDEAARLERIGKLLDRDRFVSFAAMEAITGHWDGYVQGRNNYHVYGDPKGGKLVFFPHGTDQLFQDPSYPLVPPLNGIVARAVLEGPGGRRPYRDRLRQLVEDVFRPDRLRERIREVAGRLEPALRAGGDGAVAAHAAAVRSLISRIEARHRFLRESLKSGG